MSELFQKVRKFVLESFDSDKARKIVEPMYKKAIKELEKYK